MTTDLWMLVATVMLSFVIPLIYGTGRMQAPGGWEWGLGNRDTALPVPAWTDRAVRAHANFTENLAPFAILVLVAHVSGKANAMTALGATIFFLGRVAHVIIYTAGIAGLRTVAFFVAAVGEILILLQLF